MNTTAALLRWALEHPYLAAGLGLVMIGGTLFLAHKGVDVTKEVLKYAVEKNYSFGNGYIKVEPCPRYM